MFDVLFLFSFLLLPWLFLSPAEKKKVYDEEKQAYIREREIQLTAESGNIWDSETHPNLYKQRNTPQIGSGGNKEK